MLKAGPSNNNNRTVPVFLGLVLLFLAVAPEAWGRVPSLCVWSHLLPSCPACGSTRALSAFFHFRFSDAIAFHWNVLLTAPLLIFFAWREAVRLRCWFRTRPS